jgi:4-amino-4-deoxy-L-arabinose transferase-like glycosyltransferase
VRGEFAVVLGGAAVAGIALLTNIASSPDTQYDEVVYTRAAQQVAQNWDLTWSNTAFFVHPPLSFLAQSGWLRLLGLQNAPLEQAIVAARVLSAGTAVFAVLLLGLMTAYLAPAAGRVRGLVLVGIVVGVAAFDPVMLRYGRLALIEPFALIAAMLTLCLAIRLRDSGAWVYVPVVGLATGLTLLTKEVTAFCLFTPIVHAVLSHDRRRVAVTTGGFAWGLGLWLLFPLWAVALGLTPDFVDVKFATFERLLGLVQITGWNRPGVSFASAVVGQLGAYAMSYLFLALGGLALLWLMTRAVPGAARWLLAWLVTSYAFAAYMVLLGTLNEQFFVYILPAAIVGTVMAGDAALTRLRGVRARAALAATAALLVLGTSVIGWVRHYTTDNAAIFAITAMIRDTLPSCATISVTGDPDRFSYLLPGTTIATFATGEGAQAHGVHLFILSDKDVSSGYGDATAELTRWVRDHGTLVADHATFTYDGLQVWRTPVDPYAPLADTEQIPGGTFVVTDANRCGGFPVADQFATGLAALGGRQVVGAPVSASFPAGPGVSAQVFTGAVLTAAGSAPATAAPVVARLASADAAAYRAAGLPPVTASDPADLLTDPAITAAPAGAGLGDPIGPPTTMPDGWVRQAFANGVLEHAPGVADVRLAEIGPLVRTAGLFNPPAAAATPLAAPPLTTDIQPGQPSTVRPFVTALLAGLALYAALPVLAVETAVLLRRRRRGSTR